MDPYAGYSAIEELDIPERVRYLKKSTLMCLERGLTRQQVLDAAEQAIENEQYELVQGINAALEEFDQNPQLALKLI